MQYIQYLYNICKYICLFIIYQHVISICSKPTVVKLKRNQNRPSFSKSRQGRLQGWGTEITAHPILAPHLLSIKWRKSYSTNLIRPKFVNPSAPHSLFFTDDIRGWGVLMNPRPPHLFQRISGSADIQISSCVTTIGQRKKTVEPVRKTLKRKREQSQDYL